MAIKQFNARITMKRDTAANWEQNNPVLLNGEIIIVDTASGEVRFKIGDGTKLYKQLPFSDEAVRALISAKEDKISLTENRAVISDASGKLSVSDVTSTELSYLDGVSSNVQTQLNNKVPTTRKINSKPLSSDITLNASDVNAVPTSRKINGKALSSDITLSATDVNALPSSTTIPSKTSQLTNDSNFVTSTQLNGKVDKVSGKGLSTNDLTDTLKANYDAAYNYSISTHAPTDAEKNVIVGIQKNGTDLSVNSSTRKVNITVPTSASDVGAVPTSRKINGKTLSSDITLNASDVSALPSTTTIPSKTSQLTNDSGFITSSDIPQLSRASVSIANDNTSTIDIPITIVDPNYLTVYQNGLILTPTTHYTATTTAITLVGYTADAGDIFTFVGTAESGASLNSSASEVLFSDTTEDGAYSGCTTVQDALIHAAGFKSDVQSISVNGVEVTPVDGAVNISGVVKSISVNGTDVPIDQNGQASITGVVKSISVNGTNISIDSSGSASITGLVKTISVNGTNINVDNTGAVAITGLVKSLSLNGTSYTPNSSGVLSLTNIMKTNTDQTMSAKLIAQNNTDYTTAQLRNVIISTQDPSGGNNGDIWIKYTV